MFTLGPRAQEFAQGGGCTAQLFIEGQAIGTEAEPVPAGIANDTLALEDGWKIHRPFKGDGEKCSVVLVATPHRAHAGLVEVFTQGVELLEAVRAESLNPHSKREFQTAAGLIPGEHGWSGLEKSIAIAAEHRRLGPVICKGVGIGKPTDVEGAQAGHEGARRNV
jgi:hypothetical protein